MNKKALSIAMIVFGLAANGVATAESYNYSGVVTLCTGTCASFASLDIGTQVTGTWEINTSLGGAWAFADAGVFTAEVFNPGAPGEPFDGTNPTTANPLPLNALVAPIKADEPTQGLTTGGTTDAANELNSGNILHEFIVPPFNNNEAWVVFDIGAGGVAQAQVCLFFPTAGCIPGATQAVVIDGQFSIVSALSVDPASVDFGQVMTGQSAQVDVTLTSLFDDVTVHLLDGLVAPFSFGQDNCSLQVLQLLETCTVTVEFRPRAFGQFVDDFDISAVGFVAEEHVSVTGEGIRDGGNDQDGDGVPDDSDNCTLVANPAQTDTDVDGIGNACDADLDNNCVINFADLGIMKSVFFTADPEADLDGNGVVNFADLGIMKAAFFGPPGPGAPGNDCDNS